MKKAAAGLIAIIMMLGIVISADAATVINLTQQRLIFKTASGRTVNLVAGGTVSLSDRELRSQQVQRLIQNNSISIRQ